MMSVIIGSIRIFKLVYHLLLPHFSGAALNDREEIE